MAKKDLFSLRTDRGYGLFQEYDSYPNTFNYTFYIVYYTQIKTLSDKEIEEAMQGEYYYSRIGLGYDFIWTKGFDKATLLDNPRKEFDAKDFGIKEESPYYGKCAITYLGQYELPLGVELPKFSRVLDLSKLSGKYKWFIQNEMNNCLEKNERNNNISYKQLDSIIERYPRYYVTPPMEIRKRFNADYRQTEDDKWVERYFEELYQEYPDLRPTKLKFNDVKFPLPTEELREMSKDIDEEKERKEYEIFCDKIEGLCMAFLDGIEKDKKSTKKHLISIIEGLNNLNNENGLINTMEAEIIYAYLVKILKSLKRVSLIEEIEERRNW